MILAYLRDEKEKRAFTQINDGLCYNLYQMSYLFQQFDIYRDRLRLGSMTIRSSDYPFASFLIGYLISKHNLSIQQLFEFLQLLYSLREVSLTEGEFKIMIRLVEDFPKDIRKFTGVLSNIRNSKHVKINELVKSYYCYERLFAEPSQKSQDKVEPSSPLVSSSPSVVANEGTHKLDNTGTQQQDNNPTQKLGNTMQLDQFLQTSNTDEMELEKEERRKMQEADIEMARRMQEEFNNEPIKQEEDQILCAICYSNLYDDQFLPLDYCGHLFHKNCLSESFKSNIITNNFPLRCPNDECKIEATQSDIRNILDKQQIQKYQRNTLKFYAELNGDSISWCPTANCNYMFFYQKDDSQRFECLQCKKEYCLNCRVDWHQDMTCKQYKINNTTSEDDQLFIDFVKGKKFKQCPRCKFWVQKNQGCNHMTCKCKFQFCYKCGGVYMKCECVARHLVEREKFKERYRQQRRLKLENMMKAAKETMEAKEKQKAALSQAAFTSSSKRRRK